MNIKTVCVIIFKKDLRSFEGDFAVAFGIFDGHCDTLTMLKDGEHLYDAEKDFNIKQAESYDYFIQVVDIWVDVARDSVDEKVNKYIDQFYIELSKNPSVKQICTKQDLLEHREGVHFILGIEGGEAVGRDLRRLEELYRKGVRLITLTWNTPYAISDTCVKTQERLNGENDYAGGLTHFGKDVVREMNRLGMIIDVSHISDKGFYDVVQTTEKPFIASHSNARAQCAHPRNLTDDMFLRLKEKGGVTGINFCRGFLRDDGNPAGMDDLIRHIEHFMALGGEKNVGLGTDFDGIDGLPEGFTGTRDLGKLCEALLRRNYSEDLVRDLMSRNMERVFQESL